MFPFKMAKVVNFLWSLLKTSINYYFIQIKARVKAVYLTVANNVHFWIREKQILCHHYQKKKQFPP